MVKSDLAERIGVEVSWAFTTRGNPVKTTIKIVNKIINL
jgi:hypothetical protein